MEPTPNSEVSEYFDAPIMHFRTQRQEPNHPSSPTPPPAAVGASLTDEGEESAGSPTAQGNRLPGESDGWLPATDAPPASDKDAPQQNQDSRAAMYNLAAKSPRQPAGNGSHSTSSLHSAPRRSGSQRRAASLSGRQSLFTNKDDGQPVDGSTFIYGAGTTGPNTEPELSESLHQRAASVGASLSPKQRSKVQKTDIKESRRLSKIIKQEGKVEKEALSVAIKQLEELQKIQKESVKREAKAHTAHAASLATFQKHEQIFLAARRKYEVLQAQLNADMEALEISRHNAREATAEMQEKSREIGGLRVMLKVDESERAVKLDELKGKNVNGQGKTANNHGGNGTLLSKLKR